MSPDINNYSKYATIKYPYSCISQKIIKTCKKLFFKAVLVDLKKVCLDNLKLYKSRKKSPYLFKNRKALFSKAHRDCDDVNFLQQVACFFVIKFNDEIKVDKLQYKTLVSCSYQKRLIGFVLNCNTFLLWNVTIFFQNALQSISWRVK